jgi:hypothetical protein
MPDTTSPDDTTVDASPDSSIDGDPELTIEPKSLDEALLAGQTRNLTANYDDDGTGLDCGELVWSSDAPSIARTIDSSTNNQSAMAQGYASGETQIRVECNNLDLSASVAFGVIGPPADLVAAEEGHLGLWLNPSTLKQRAETSVVRRWNDLGPGGVDMLRRSDTEPPADSDVQYTMHEELGEPIARFEDDLNTLHPSPYSDGYAQGAEMTAFFVIRPDNGDGFAKLLNGCSIPNEPSNNQIKLDPSSGTLQVAVSQNANDVSTITVDTDQHVSVGDWTSFAVMIVRKTTEWEVQFIPGSDPAYTISDTAPTVLTDDDIEFNQLGRFCSNNEEIFAGNMAEIMVFERALLDPAPREQVFEYLQQRYNDLL